MLSILIVEDEIKIAESLKGYFEAYGYQVQTVSKGREAIEIFEKENFQLILLDLMLPDLSGEEVCRYIRSRSRVPIIMVTAKVEEEDLLTGLGIGADDYVTKPFSLKTLKARVEAVLRRSAQDVMALSDNMSLPSGEIVIDSIRREVRKSGQVVQLTPYEFNIVMVMAKYPSKVFTREELIQLALGDDFDGFDRAIDVHIKNIRQKLEDNPKSPKLIKTIYGIGYRMGGEEG